MVRSFILKSKRAVLRAVIIGSTKNTEYLSDYIAAFPESGFTLAGVVAAAKYIPKDCVANNILHSRRPCARLSLM